MKHLLSMAIVVLMSMAVVSGVSYGACDPSNLYTPGDKLNCILEMLTELQNPNISTTLSTSLLEAGLDEIINCTIVNVGSTDIKVEFHIKDVFGAEIGGGGPDTLTPGTGISLGKGNTGKPTFGYCQVKVLQGSVSSVRANLCVEDFAKSSFKACSEAR